MSDATSVPQLRYKVPMFRGGVEEVDRFGVRDLIRNGEVTAQTELAVVGTDEWRPADSYPELARYFSMVTSQPLPRGPMGAPSKPRVVEPMSQRVVQGLLYPLAGGEAFMLIGLAVMSVLPFVSRLAALASTVIMVGIVRASADGKVKMPLIDTSNLWELLRTSLRVLFISFVSLLPVLAALFFVVAGLISKAIAMPVALAALALAFAVSAIYYPACLATIAVWDDMLSSLNPMYVYRVITIIGRDYFIAIAVFFVATFGASLMALPIVGSIPLIGGIFKSAVSYWALFYASHILGYAVYRHARELGWE